MTDTEKRSSNQIFTLYVDDEPDLLTLGKLFLERSGEFKVTTLTSAIEALNSSDILTCDAIISDYQMPEMDGIAFLKVVRERYGDIPFILFTGRGREEVVIEAINNGADFYQQKGGDPKPQFVELAHKIKQAVNSKQARLAVSESEKKLFDIIDFLPDATFAIDSSGTIIAWNHAIEEMTGFFSGDMVGKGDYEYALPFYGVRRPVLIDLIGEMDENISPLYQKISHSDNSLMAETVLVTPIGKEIFASVKACPLYNQSGEIIGAIESIRDITEMRRAEGDLKKSEEKFRNLVHYSRDCILIVDFTGKIHYINRTGLLMVDEEDSDAIIGKKNVMEYVHPESREIVTNDMSEVARGNDAYISQYRLITGKKRDIWVESLGRKIPYGKSVAILVSLRDITERKKAVDNLRESEEQFRALTEQSPDIIVRIDRDYKILYCNQKLTEYTGIPVEQLIGTDSRHFHGHAEEVASWIHAIERVFETGLSSRMEWNLNSDTWFDCLCYPEFGANNEVKTVTTSIRDVTLNKKIEEERETYYKDLLIQRGFTEALLDALPIPVQWKDMNRRYLGCNKELGKFLGVLQDEIIGKTIEEVWPHKDESDEIYKQDQEVISSGILHQYKTILHDRSEKKHDVIISKNLFRDCEGNIAGIIGTLHDITEYNQLIQDLKTREEFFRMIVTQSSDLFIVISPQLEVTYISPNAAQLSGFLSEEVIGPAGFFIHPEDLNRISCQLERLIQNPSSSEEAEFRSLKRDGSYLLLKGVAVNCIDNPAIQGILITAVDISEKNQLRNKLDARLSQNELLEKLVQERTIEVSHLLELKNSLITGIAHELRTPLTPLRVLLPLLREETDPKKRMEIIRIIESNAAKIAKIVEQTLYLATMGTVYKIEDLSEVNISDRIEYLLHVYSLAAQKKKISIVHTIPSHLILHTSSPHFISVLDNIISNALKYSKYGGTIRISAIESEDTVTLSIRDDGVGMNSEELQRVFEPFYKVDPSRHDRSSPGLGLSVTKQLILAIGGNITIQSDGPDKGTEVHLTFKKS